MVKKNALIVGSSGMVGSIVLREALASDSIAAVSSLVRTASGISHSKLSEIIHEDFTSLDSVSDHFKRIDIAFFCIGEYTGAVPDDEFRKVTVDLAVEFGDVLKANSPHARLCFLSGQGADRKEKSRVSFARYKGMAENHLLRLDLGGIHIFRPGYIYPVQKRKEPNFSYGLFRLLYPILGRFIPHVTSEELGKAMFNVGVKGHDLDTLENMDIKSLST